MSELDFNQWKDVVAVVTQPRSGAEMTELVNAAVFDEDKLEQVQARLTRVIEALSMHRGPIAVGADELEHDEEELWALFYDRLPSEGQGVPDSVARRDEQASGEDMREAASMNMLIIEQLYSGVIAHVLSPADSDDTSRARAKIKRRIKVIPRLVVRSEPGGVRHLGADAAEEGRAGWGDGEGVRLIAAIRSVAGGSDASVRRAERAAKKAPTAGVHFWETLTEQNSTEFNELKHDMDLGKNFFSRTHARARTHTQSRM